MLLTLSLLLSLIIAIAAQPTVENALPSTPVAVSDEDIAFEADIFWRTADYTVPSSGLVYWRLHRSGDNNIIKDGNFDMVDDGLLTTSFGDQFHDDHIGKNKYIIEVSLNETFPLDGTSQTSLFINVVPGAVTLIPPLLTVIAAVSTHNVLFSLLVGIYFAALLIWNFNPFYAFINTFSQLIVQNFATKDHVFILLFTWILSGMVSCILKSGGGEGLVNAMAKYATTPRAGCLVAFALGLMIFFDDYANTLIVGQTVRPITDTLFISRQKLAFLVDATSAPVASISPISSWIGFELSLIDDTITKLEDSGEDMSCYDSSAFIIFLNTIISRFYPMLMLSLQFFLIMVGREFGPMLMAEREAREKQKEHAPRDSELYRVDIELSKDGHSTSSLPANLITDIDDDPESKESHRGSILAPARSTPRRWYNAVVPIVVAILVVLISLICTGVVGNRKEGSKQNGQNIFSNSKSFESLLYGSIAGTMCIWIMTYVERVTKDGELTTVFHAEGRLESSRPLMSMDLSLELFIHGIKSLVDAFLILLLAWTVGGTGIYISSALQDNLDAGAYPALTFIISAILALVTGSSWGTLSIMFPLILPAAHYADPCNKTVFYGTISSILAGSVFGDHCSPISDTTVLSAVACKCTLMSHVQTQMPYAVLAGVVGLMLGDLPTGYEAYPEAVGLVLGIVGVCSIAYLISAPIEGTKLDVVTSAFTYVTSKFSPVPDSNRARDADTRNPVHES